LIPIAHKIVHSGQSNAAGVDKDSKAQTMSAAAALGRKIKINYLHILKSDGDRIAETPQRAGFYSSGSHNKPTSISPQLDFCSTLS